MSDTADRIYCTACGRTMTQVAERGHQQACPIPLTDEELEDAAELAEYKAAFQYAQVTRDELVSFDAKLRAMKGRA